jgi:hypothetical protein
MNLNHDRYDNMLDVYYRHSCVGKSYAPYAEPPDIIGMHNKGHDLWQKTNAFDYYYAQPRHSRSAAGVARSWLQQALAAAGLVVVRSG